MIGIEINGKVRRAASIEEARRLVDGEIERKRRREDQRLLAGSLVGALIIASLAVVVMGLADGWL